MVDAAHDKEKRDKETIRNLKDEVANLMKIGEQQTGVSMDQEQRWVICPPFHGLNCVDTVSKVSGTNCNQFFSVIY